MPVASTSFVERFQITLQINEFGQGDEIILIERVYCRAAQFADMAEAAQFTAQVPGQRTHIGALAAFHFKDGYILAAGLNDVEAVNFHLARFDLHFLAVAGELVGAFAIDLDGGILRRNLFDLADVIWQDRREFPLRWAVCR